MKTSSPIRLAQPSDEPEILVNLQVMWRENGWRNLDLDRARATFGIAWSRKGAIFSVIGAPGHIRAMQFLMLCKHWYSNDDHLEEVFCWVHPDHRHSDYARLLLEHAKKCSDDLSKNAGYKIPLLIGVLTNRRMEAKVRLYRRFFGPPVGAFFLHNADWITKDDLSEEDFWRLPKLTKMFDRRRERREKRHNGVTA